MCIRDRDYPLYKRFYYDYQCRSMEPDRIVPDCFTFYLLSQYPLPWQPGRTLLDMIMQMCIRDTSIAPSVHEI